MDHVTPRANWRLLWVLVALAPLCAAAPSLGAEGFGPFPVRNFQALAQLVLAMPGEQATVLRKGDFDVRLELANTASIARDSEEQAEVSMKFETLRSGLFLRYGLTDRLELGAEVPVLHRYRGFMEGAILGVERATTGEAPARTALRDTGYAFNISNRQRTIFQGNEGATGLGDISFYSKYQLLRESSSLPALAVRLGVKAPTGDTGEVFGSGHPDVGIGVAVQKTFAANWIVYANVNGIFPTGKIVGLGVQPVMTGLVAVEYLWSDNLSFTAQFDYYSPPFHGTGTRVLDKGVTESVIGVSYRILPQLIWQLYGVENLDFITGSAADFTASTLFTYRFRS
ncbi:MAG: hypothetical protein NBKEAIPA_02879 [Nitrospirae bacterium]|nr:MAG: hypothetical protein UZ03_NOB001000870 [Nitrospira sp. OLB3]MBV6470954.1 hypothetical protein [Nitrospirota bacterium]MCE7966416.1 DUF3187 family protein [Nitrospira sp. NTP2]RIK56822.1 MAG: hypothetical protein DCC63_15995 [Nitrospira sp.]